MVKRPAVVDSACLIGLERIGRLDLLPALLDPIFAPTAVEAELGSHPAWMIVEPATDNGIDRAHLLWALVFLMLSLSSPLLVHCPLSA